MRDFKPENCLLTEKLDLKICDFGWATEDTDIEYSMIRAGTLPYMSPESLLEKKQSYKSDVWSLGVFLYELIFQREPYLNATVEKQLQDIHNNKIDFTKGFIIETAKNLIEKMLVIKEEERVSMRHIFSEKYFTSEEQNYWIDRQVKKDDRRDTSVIVKR